jgi:hypothetical protein
MPNNKKHVEENRLVVKKISPQTKMHDLTVLTFVCLKSIERRNVQG